MVPARPGYVRRSDCIARKMNAAAVEVIDFSTAFGCPQRGAFEESDGFFSNQSS